jgi:hypothetical protein
MIKCEHFVRENESATIGYAVLACRHGDALE